jgi:hypothetical protein
MALTALAGLATFLTPVAPASALSVTTPSTLPALLPPIALPPIQLPVGGTVSGGTGGAPIDITVTVPGSTGIEATLPGLPKLPAPSVAPPDSVPVTFPSGDPVVNPTPASPSPSLRGVSDPAVLVPGDHAVTLQPSAPVPAADSTSSAAPSFLPLSSARPANVSAAIDAQPADSLLQGVQAFASRVALWAALAAIVFVLQMLVGSAARQRRSARVS